MLPDLSSPPPSQSVSAHALSIPEILLNIFSHLADSGDTSSLALCARVATVWLGPARSALYTDLKITWRLSTVDAFAHALEANASLSNLVQICQIDEFSLDDLEIEVYNEFDWKSFLNAKGYEWDEDGWSQADQDKAHNATADVRYAKEEELAREEVDYFWMDGHAGAHQSYLTLLDFLERLVNLRILILYHGMIEPPEQAFTLSSTQRQILSRITTLEMYCRYSSFAQELLNASTGVEFLTLDQWYSDICLPPLPKLLNLSFRQERSILNLESYANSLEALHLTLYMNLPKHFHLCILHRLSFFHLSLSGTDSVDFEYASSVLQSAPNLVYFGMDISETLVHPTLLNNLFSFLPPRLYQIAIHFRDGQMEEIVKLVTSLTTCLMASSESLNRLSFDIGKTSHDFSELTMEASLQNLNLEIGYGVADITGVDRMRASWRANSVDFRV